MMKFWNLMVPTRDGGITVLCSRTDLRDTVSLATAPFPSSVNLLATVRIYKPPQAIYYRLLITQSCHLVFPERRAPYRWYSGHNHKAEHHSRYHLLIIRHC